MAPTNATAHSAGGAGRGAEVKAAVTQRFVNYRSGWVSSSMTDRRLTGHPLPNLSKAAPSSPAPIIMGKEAPMKIPAVYSDDTSPIKKDMDARPGPRTR